MRSATGVIAQGGDVWFLTASGSITWGIGDAPTQTWNTFLEFPWRVCYTSQGGASAALDTVAERWVRLN